MMMLTILLLASDCSQLPHLVYWCHRAQLYQTMRVIQLYQTYSVFCGCSSDMWFHFRHVANEVHCDFWWEAFQ